MYTSMFKLYRLPKFPGLLSVHFSCYSSSLLSQLLFYIKKKKRKRKRKKVPNTYFQILPLLKAIFSLRKYDTVFLQILFTDFFNLSKFSLEYTLYFAQGLCSVSCCILNSKVISNIQLFVKSPI